MIVLAFIAQVAVADSTYSSASVRALVTEASIANRAVPATLISYHASVESELSLVIKPAEGPEVVGQIEQTENLIDWLRTGAFEQRIVGYRVRSAGFSLSALSYMQESWMIPALYGNRFSLFFGSPDTTGMRRKRPRRNSDSAAAIPVHPFSQSREQVYRFSGGDTVALIRLRNRTVPVRRIHVEPVWKGGRLLTVFRGDIDLDGDRRQIVRMRGRFLQAGATRSVRERFARNAITPALYMELVNAEVDGQYWLPSYQRIEAQVSSAVTGDARSVFRMVSRFHEYEVNSNPVAVEIGSESDTLRVERHRLIRLPNESLEKFSQWTSETGATSEDSRAIDFDDIAPEQWRPTGAPRLELRVSRFSDILRFNRVEGLYTGYGAALRFRDAFPGLSVRAHGGWAWSEALARGAIIGELKRSRYIANLQVSRSLDATNDFIPAFDGGATLPALLLSIDNYDYVDRQLALVSVSFPLGNPEGSVAIGRLEAGVGSDGRGDRNIGRGLFGARHSFLPNRNITEGSFHRSGAQLDIRPEVSGEFVTPGVGAMVRYERGDGGVRWQRLEGRIATRRNGRITFASRIDGGMLLGGSYPLQQLFELGGTTGLPGYEYKEFAGDRAVLGRALAMLSLPIQRSPVRITRRLYLPAPSPAIAVGLQSGWTRASDSRAFGAVDRLGYRWDKRADAPVLDVNGQPIPASRPTLRARSSLDVGLRLFGGALGLALARPIDHHAGWRFVVSSSAW